MQVLDVVVQKKEPLPYTNYWLVLHSCCPLVLQQSTTPSSTRSSKGIHAPQSIHSLCCSILIYELWLPFLLLEGATIGTCKSLYGALVYLNSEV